MNRMEAEQLAYVKSRLERRNNYIAAQNEDGTWRVDAFPVHRYQRVSQNIKGIKADV